MSGIYSDAPPPLHKLVEIKKDEAVLRIMQLAIYGAIMHAGEKENQFEATERVMELFKEANLIK